MRLLTALLVAAFPAVAAAQPAEAASALKYVYALQDPAAAGFKPDPKGKPSLRACNAAVKAIRYLGGEVPNADKVSAFVMGCYDPATGGFAEPGGKADVTTTAIGVMAAVELGVPKVKFARAMDYLKDNAKTFEDVRIGAAAVEAWGVKDCPFGLAPWLALADAEGRTKPPPPRDGGARNAASYAAMKLRLGRPLGPDGHVLETLAAGQRPDGGWGKGMAGGSDLESTYRVMRAFHLLKESPRDVAALKGFLAKCRNPDGGYGVKPGEPSSVSGVYYVAIITKWLDELAK